MRSGEPGRLPVSAAAAARRWPRWRRVRSARSSPSSSPTSSGSRAGPSARRRGRPRHPRAVPRAPARPSSSATAAPSRSSSATPSWRSSARRWPTRTIPSARSARRSRSATAIDRLNEQEPGLDLHVRIAVNTGEALVALGARAGRGRGNGLRRRRQHGRAPPVRRTRRRHPRRRGDLPRDGSRDQLPAGRAGRGEGQGRAGPRVGGGRGRAPASGSTSCSGRRRRSSAAGPRWTSSSTPSAGAGRERAVQLVTLVGVPGIGKSRLVWELFEACRARAGPRHVAPGPVAAVRRRRHLLGAGRDDHRPVGHPRLRQRRRGEGQAQRDRRATLIGDERRPPGSRSTCGRWRASRPTGPRAATARAKRSRPGDAFSRRSQSAARSCSCSRTSTGPTTALLDFVDHLVDGRAACRCSWSAPLARSCSIAAPDWGGGKRNALDDRPLAARRRRVARTDRRPARAGRAPGRDCRRSSLRGAGQPALRRGVRADADRPRHLRHDAADGGSRPGELPFPSRCTG